MTDNLGCDVVVTTGGTGPAERDVTPEATMQVCDRILPVSRTNEKLFHWVVPPPSSLDRLAELEEKSDFQPSGRPKAIRETIDEIWKAVPYYVDLLAARTST